jgi:hypothetical protein
VDPALTARGLNDALSGRYVIEREIGSGGMATVYLAMDIPANRGWDVDPTGTRFVYGGEPREARPLRLAITVNALADSTLPPSSRPGVP